jgi:hypothetical protein
MRFFLILLLLIPAITLADSIELTWDIPTQRTDNTALATEEIDGYAIDYTHNNGEQQTIIVDGGLTQLHTINDALPGSYVFQIATISNEQVGPSSNPITLTLAEIRKAEAGAPVVRVHLSCDNCNLEVK